jgi:pimeloyl-ACP methyl ester carboxylesterase
MRRVILASAVVVVLVVAGVIGWSYSNQILGPDKPPGRTGQRVLAHTDSTITLTSTFKARRPGYWAISWPGGFGHIGPLVSVDSERVVTRFQIASGSPPDTTSRLAGFAPDADPLTWLGTEFVNDTIPARVGPLPAWRVPGRDSTWAIFVHGRAATRAEVLRMLPGYRALDKTCLIVTYRNDDGAPRIDGGQFRMGLTEWQDVEDAVRYAHAQGARGVVVVGCSMGGSIVAQFLRRSPDRSLARAAVLDAPALDWNAVFGLAGRQKGLPDFMTEYGKWVASWRGGLRWYELTSTPHAAEFVTPMLIFHGDADQTVPIEVSEEFAKARPDLVTFHVVHGAGHVESANVDPVGYAATIESWLRERGIGH